MYKVLLLNLRGRGLGGLPPFPKLAVMAESLDLRWRGLGADIRPQRSRGQVSLLTVQDLGSGPFQLKNDYS